MPLPLQFASVAQAKLPAGPLHLAIGMFDGVHLGHRAVIEAGVQSARRSGGLCAVLTFRPHPSALFRPEQPTLLLQGKDIQAQVLGQLGVDAVITEPFTPEFAQIEAAAFLPWLQARLPELAAVYVGENWRFGAQRAGDVATLVAAGRRANIGVFSAPPVKFNGEPVNSTRIRHLVAAGEMEAANRLLGYTYFAQGQVTPGQRLGRQLGFPTLNLPWAPALRPQYGVYQVAASGPRAPGSLPGVANYGVRPTIGASTVPQLEVHVLGPCPFDAGDELRVEWRRFLRPEAKFASLADLRAQIERDVAAVR